MERSRNEVRATYDRIAEHFSKTREYAWPEVESFVDERAVGSAVGLDLGCGNGRHAELLAGDCDRVLALDASLGLLGAARERAADRGFSVDLLAGDASRLPLRDGAIDVAVYVATLHHLPTREARLASLRELGRVLGDGGRALVSAWSTAHDRFDRDESFDTHVDWTLPDGETVPRFYHVYAPDDFERDLAESGGLRVVSSRVSSGNCYAVVGPAE